MTGALLAVMRIIARMMASITLTRIMRLRIRMRISALASNGNNNLAGSHFSATCYSLQPCLLAKNEVWQSYISSEDERVAQFPR